MGSLALLARAAGHTVTGADSGVYPPMSTQLEAAGIALVDGFSEDQLAIKPDVFVVGNVISRGNPLMEAILNRGLPYISGPQWLSEQVLAGRWVLAVAGTHGKTTTASMLAWILEYAGMAPGFLIGGVPANFSVSARSGSSDFFVIEADEYDTAFFDKRSKFIHYHPNTLVINNLEFDHADIFADLAAIQRQFHHLLRIVPENGLLVYPQSEPAIDEVLAMGCWCERQSLSLRGEDADWRLRPLVNDGSAFDVLFGDAAPVRVEWGLTGQHNLSNALAAIAAARHVGIEPGVAAQALCAFSGVKRRMERVGESAQVVIYDDFAHHPTAIASTLEGLRAQVGGALILAIIEPRSNTMKQGIYKSELSSAVAAADDSYWYQPPGLEWSLSDALLSSGKAQVFTSTEAIIDAVVKLVSGASEKLHIVIMSNGGFEAIHQRLCAALKL